MTGLRDTSVFISVHMLRILMNDFVLRFRPNHSGDFGQLIF